MKSDLQLIEEYLSGNEGSFRELIRRYIDTIYKYSFRFTGNKADSEDIVQNVFVKVWRNIHKFDIDKTFKTWIFTIARNTIFDHLRKKKEYVFSDLEDNEGESELLDNLSDNDEHIEDKIFRVENAGKVRVAVAGLSDVYKEVLSLHYDEDLTFVEIASILGKPLNTVKSLHRRALIKLKISLSAPK